MITSVPYSRSRCIWRRSARLTWVVTCVLAAGCTGTNVPLEIDEAKLDRLTRSRGHELYYLGRSFEGLPLTHVSSSGGGYAVFIYGDCDPDDGGLLDFVPSDGGCAPPVQIQHFPFDPSDWTIATGCRRLRDLRGVPTARHDGLVLFTGRQIVKIYGMSGAQDRRIARALRPLNGSGGGRSLPPPPKRELPLIEEACGRA